MGSAETDRPRRYFGLHYILLRVLGIGWWHHPDEGDTRNFPGWYLYYSIITQLVWVVGFVGLESIDPFIGKKDLDKFMMSLSFVITHDLTVIKLCLFYFRHAEIQDIVRILEIDLHNYYQNNSKTRATIRITRILTGSFLFFGWMTIGNSAVYGIYEDLQWRAEVSSHNGTTPLPIRTLPQPIYIPWNYQKDASYIFTFALENIGLLWTGHIVMTIDTFIGSVILHLSSQFAIFQEAIATMYDRTIAQLAERIRQGNDNSIMNDDNNLDRNEKIVSTHYTEEEVYSALEESLRKCIHQHQLLIRCRKKFQAFKNCTRTSSHKNSRPFQQTAFISCAEKFSKTYSYGFMTQLLSSMAAIGVVMVQVSHDASSFKSIRLVTSLAFFVAMTIQLAIQCYTGNELTIEAEGVVTAVMESKWERMPVRLRRPLLYMMMRAQRPLRLSAAGFANMDNACFFAIMKAAYSYYAVLSQKQE